MSRAFETPEEAYVETTRKVGAIDAYVPIGLNAAFVCPHCNSLADHKWAVMDDATIWQTQTTRGERRLNFAKSGILVAARCMACDEEVIFHNGKVIFPQVATAPMPTADLPPEVYDDYMEARSISGASPRGAAALLRLVLEKMLPALGATETKIDRGIGELVAKGTINKSLQQALDTVRVIGNESVHPGTIDLRDDPTTVQALFKLINFIVERGITEPRQIGELYATLPPNKLAGIANRDRGAGLQAENK